MSEEKRTPTPFIVVPRPHADSLVYKLWGVDTPEGEREALPPRTVVQLARLFEEESGS